MGRKYNNQPNHHSDQNKETGGREAREGRSSVSGNDESEGNPTERKEIQIAFVDEAIEVERDESSITETATPSADLGAVESTEIPVFKTSTFRVKKIHQQVTPLFLHTDTRPSSDQLSYPVLGELIAQTTSHPDINTVSPTQQVEIEEGFQITTLSELQTNSLDHSVSQQMNPNQRRSQDREPLELDEEDPVFGWTGGSPYNSGTPKVVIHRDSEELPTLPYLQVLLRDTYKEIEGGEPGAETVEFVANEPRIPQVQGNIVTLDLTGDAWTSDMRGEKPVIKRNDVDIVPKLRDVASTLYTGDLGYFVVNVPDEWEGDLIQEDFFNALLSRISGTDDRRDDVDQAVFDTLQSSPVVVADPKIENDNELFANVTQYFSLSDNVDRFSRVQQAESVMLEGLRRNDWKRIALTERQRTDNESDEHYFWKAAIAEGLAWEMKKYHETQERADQTDQSFAAFLTEQILSESRIKSETEIGNSEIVPDLLVKSTHRNWVTNGVKEFLNIDERLGRDVIIEFETGRSEGAFNFRKVRESLEKYTNSEVRNTRIYLVLPTRLFFRGEKRARMILNLVDSWDRESENRLSAHAAVPVLKDGYCCELESATQLVDSLYGGAGA